jgi:hypothetical protein
LGVVMSSEYELKEIEEMKEKQKEFKKMIKDFGERDLALAVFDAWAIAKPEERANIESAVDWFIPLSPKVAKKAKEYIERAKRYETESVNG